MTTRMKKLSALLLAGSMLLATVGCGSTAEESVEASKESTKQSTVEATGEAAGEEPKEVTTITFYPEGANNITSGVIGGWKGEWFKSLGIELDIWSYSDDKTNAILASGDLPDVMVVPQAHLEDMIEAGLLLELDDYLDQMPNVSAYEQMDTALNYVREYKSAGTGKVYGLPQKVGSNSLRHSMVDSTDRRAVKLKWDVYEAIGAPEINSFDDLIDVMEMMVDACPEDADGVPYYGTILNTGMDNQYWGCMMLWFYWQGYEVNDLPYLLETNMVDGTSSSILTKDSLYYAGLKWYNEVYRRGLMDPDSINAERNVQKAKVDAGYAMVPSGTLPAWASGNYYEYYIPGTTIYNNYTGNPYGGTLLAINAKTENLDACLKFLDAMCDPETYLVINNGPEGDYWYTDEAGNLLLTDAAVEHLTAQANGTGTGAFTLSTGEDLELFALPWLVNGGEYTPYKDGKGNYRIFANAEWQERQEILLNNENHKKWEETTGYSNWIEWLEAEDAFCDSSPLDSVKTFCSLPDANMQLTVDALRDIVVTASWKMVYAESDSEFESIWDQMVADCEGLDAQSVMDWRLADIENAIATRESLIAE